MQVQLVRSVNPHHAPATLPALFLTESIAMKHSFPTRLRTGSCVLLLAASFLLVAGCANGRTAMTTSGEIPAMLQRQADAWNKGDIDTFMEPYWQSPDLTFSTGVRLTRGFAATLERYRNRYPTPDAMGRLTFSDLEIIDLSPSAALVLGAWHLDRDEPVGGLFTLVLRREHGRWIIIHDHTSMLADV